MSKFKKILVVLGIVFVVILVLLIILAVGSWVIRQSQVSSPTRLSSPAGYSRMSLESASTGLGARESSGLSDFAESFLRTPSASKAPAGGFEQTTPEGTSRLVIKTGSLNIVVKDISDSVKKIVRYVEAKDGWVVSSNITERKDITSGNVTVRVSAKSFDEALAHFRGLAEKVEYEGISGADVTEEYIDLQSRLKNLEATEVQLLKIMEKSGTIPDVLAAQRELTRTREQIERIKGQMQYLEKNVKMSTISVNLALSAEELPIPEGEKWRPIYIIKRAWRSVINFIKSISYLLIWIVIYAIVWVPLAAIVWLIRKSWKRRKAKQGLNFKE